MLIKEQPFQHNPEKPHTENKAKHEPSGYSLSLICSFDSTKNKHYAYREKNCVEHFCRKLKELGIEIINYEKKDMIPVTNEKIKFHENKKQCNICKKGFFRNKKDKYKHIKVRDHCHYTGKFRGAAHSICNLRYAMPKKIPIIIHNRLTYDDHFMIKQLSEEFEVQFKCLRENTEKYITYSVPIKKKVVHDNDYDDEKKKTAECRLNFIDNCRLMPGKLSDLVDNLSKIHDKECKKCMERKKIRAKCRFIGFRNDRLHYRCKECNKICTKAPKEAIKHFSILYQFCKGDLNIFFCY